jgi:LacI family transcriptional regulator
MSTIYDVARHAGVSPKTVSRVLNGDGPVKDATRQVVEEAILALGYVPSSAAQSMRSNRSGLIGLITGAISLSPNTEAATGLPDLYLVQAIQSGIAASGKTLMIADTGGRADRVAPLVRTFLQHRVDGLIYVADYHRQVSLPRIDFGCPVVLANSFDDRGTAAVVPDDRRGQFMLVEALIRNGHRRIGYLTLPPDMVATQERKAGYRDALTAAGLPYDPALVVSGYLDDHDQGSQLLWDAIDRLMLLPEPPTVLCCGNDAMAMRTYGILRTRGLKVPDEISVAGYDNYRTIAESLFPPLTTVELPYAAIGARAAELLLALINGEPLPGPNPMRVSGPVSWRGSVSSRNAVQILNTNGRILK